MSVRHGDRVWLPCEASKSTCCSLSEAASTMSAMCSPTSGRLDSDVVAPPVTGTPGDAATIPKAEGSSQRPLDNPAEVGFNDDVAATVEPPLSRMCQWSSGRDDFDVLRPPSS